MPPLSSARLSYRYHSTTCTRCYRRQPLFHHRRTSKATMFVVSFRRCLPFHSSSNVDRSRFPTPNRRSNVSPYPFHKSYVSLSLSVERKKEGEKTRFRSRNCFPTFEYRSLTPPYYSSLRTTSPLLNPLLNWRPRLENAPRIGKKKSGEYREGVKKRH